MNDFISTEGVKVATRHNGGLHIDGHTYLSPADVRALREYFAQDHPDLAAARARWQHQEDARLGRWRWPENPDYVVYGPEKVEGDDKGGVWVLCESDPGSIRYASPGPQNWPSSEAHYARAARAYFDAHPEPKPPWGDATAGEVWELTLTDRSFDPVAAMWDGDGFMHIDVKPTRVALHDVASARRIWPEVTS